VRRRRADASKEAAGAGLIRRDRPRVTRSAPGAASSEHTGELADRYGLAKFLGQEADRCRWCDPG